MFNAQMFVVPVMQGYIRSGDITIWARLKQGVWDNIMFYAACGVGGLVVILYAVFGLRLSPYGLFTQDVFDYAGDTNGQRVWSGIADFAYGIWISGVSPIAVGKLGREACFDYNRAGDSRT